MGNVQLSIEGISLKEVLIAQKKNVKTWVITVIIIIIIIIINMIKKDWLVGSV